jgi:hypothetical protein
MWPTIAASVVDLPEPVALVHRTRPRCSSARAATPSGSCSSVNDGMSEGMSRKANEIDQRWRKPLTRKRGSLGGVYARSNSPVSSNAARRVGSSRATVFRHPPAAPDRAPATLRAGRACRPDVGQAPGRSSGVRRLRRPDGMRQKGVEIHASLIGTRQEGLYLGRGSAERLRGGQTRQSCNRLQRRA